MAWVMVALCGVALGQSGSPKLVATSPEGLGVWFLLGDAHAGYCNSVVIEMKDYLILVDPSYPGRTRELMKEIPQLSSKPVRYVFDTHAHGDHAYGNSLWTRAGAKTMAFAGVAEEMNMYEPTRWQSAMVKREDMKALGESDVQRPRLSLRGRKFVLKDKTREVDFLFLGWGHTRGDGWVWLPKERILCTGDAAVNGPRNKLWDADVANWPTVIDKAVALGPKVVLPGHGDAGGVEILTGQAKFLRDLYRGVADEVRKGDTVEQAEAAVVMSAADANWNRPEMSQDISIVYAEIKAGRPAGSLPHVWQ
jgi:glyoxylase-like metal-dependent hydrolase (beta-lactamase superfamily II)